LKVIFGQSAGYGKKATQPCPCGYYGDAVKECSCSPSMITRYRPTSHCFGDSLRSPRISGPLLDRIDIHVEVPRVDYDKLADDRLGEPSAAIRERQRERFAGAMGGTSGKLTLLCNADTSALAAQMQVWAPPRYANTARWTAPARACSALP
jgi:magnesium chelatase family protein